MAERRITVERKNKRRKSADQLKYYSGRQNKGLKKDWKEELGLP